MGEKLFPPFSRLPIGAKYPSFSAWGLYGSKDELGTLNLLTDALVKRAASNEIKIGHHIALDMSLNALGSGVFGLDGEYEHVVKKTAEGLLAHDDVLNLNTQCSSQCLQHFAYQKERLFYNGVTEEAILAASSLFNGTQALAKKGIVGRGVLLDFHGLAKKNAPELVCQAFPPDSIAARHLEHCALAQRVAFEKGDILLIRSGFTETWNKMSENEKDKVRQEGKCHAGVERDISMLQFL